MTGKKEPQGSAFPNFSVSYKLNINILKQIKDMLF